MSKDVTSAKIIVNQPDDSTIKTPLHTPGPWGFHPERLTVYSDSQDCIVASAGGRSPEDFYWPESQEELEANAKLIAAAPDMLEALQAAEERIIELSGFANLPADGQTLSEIRSAIAKATS